MERGIGAELNQIANRQPDTRALLKATSPKSEGEMKPFRKSPAGLTDLDLAQIKPAFLNAVKVCRSDSSWSIYLHGATGRGKTYAAAAVYVLWERSAMWEDTTQLIRKIMRCRSEGSIFERVGETSVQKTEGSIMEQVSETSLVVLDDIGLRAPSEAAYDAIYELVASRKGKPTIFTSNLTPEAIHKLYDARIASRMTSGTVIEMTGSDRRMSKTRIVKV